MRALLCAAALIMGCDQGPAEPVKDAPPGQPAKPGAQPASQPSKPGALTWTKPGAWSELPNKSQMRKATYGIPKAEGDTEDGELSVMTAGGSVADNIARWEGQFGGSSKAKISDKQVGGVTVTIVELSGTFSAGPMSGGDGKPREGWMMLGAIAEAQQPYFFKLTGPQKTVEGARADFDALVSSIAAQ